MQTGTVVEYRNTFKKYLNRIQEISESELFTLFVASLKPDMQERVRLHQPSSLAAVMALALELASTQPERPQQFQSSMTTRRTWKRHEGKGHINFSPAENSAPSSTIGQQPGITGRNGEQPRVPAIRVSLAEKSKRSRKSLCWHCQEKWVIGHVCKQRLLCYVDEECRVLEEYKPNEVVDINVSHIHSMNRDLRSRPLKVVGLVQDMEFAFSLTLKVIKTSYTQPWKKSYIYIIAHWTVPSVHRQMARHWFAPMCQSELKWRCKAQFSGLTLTFCLYVDFARGDKPIVMRGIHPPPRRVGFFSLASMLPSPDTLDCYQILLLDPEVQALGPEGLEEFPANLPQWGCMTFWNGFGPCSP